MPTFLHFTDATGRPWKVYSYSVTAGRILYARADGNAQYRGFVPLDGGARRIYLLDTLSREDYRTDDATLARQFAASQIFHRDDPDHPYLPAGVERRDP